MIPLLRSKQFRTVLWTFLIVTASLSLFGEGTAPSILVVKANGETTASYTRSSIAEHEAWTELTTETPWTDEEITFEGVPLRALIPSDPQPDQQLRLLARNGYEIEVALSTILEGDGFLAFKADGRWMRLRDKGPVWLIFPFSQHPELNDGEYRRVAVWMLEEIDVSDP